jgi:precorrin-2/cobalt-factor-2 C20-methyltransferase
MTRLKRSNLTRLHGIGVGPGDPELVTVKGARLIRAADVVFVPAARIGQRSLARSIAEPYIASGQRVVELEYPTDGRAHASLERTWGANADVIATELGSNLTGVFLTEGDPMLYSTFVYTMDALRARHPEVSIEITPGVSSVTAAAAAAGVPLAVGQQRIAILPADSPESVLRSTLSGADTTILLKLSAGSDRIVDLLRELGLLEQAVWVRRCGQASQEIVHDVGTLRGRALDYFSLMIVTRRRT